MTITWWMESHISPILAPYSLSSTGMKCYRECVSPRPPYAVQSENLASGQTVAEHPTTPMKGWFSRFVSSRVTMTRWYRYNRQASPSVVTRMRIKIRSWTDFTWILPFTNERAIANRRRSSSPAINTDQARRSCRFAIVNNPDKVIK